MIDQAKLKIGEKVCYQPDHYGPDQWKNGMIKEIPDHTTQAVRVVYNCAGDLDNFKNYTSVLTYLSDLKLGWKHTQSELGIKSACFDGDQVILYGDLEEGEDHAYEIIEEWPYDWPSTVSRTFLEGRGIEVFDI